jgi:hypothetical protein
MLLLMIIMMMMIMIKSENKTETKIQELNYPLMTPTAAPSIQRSIAPTFRRHLHRPQGSLHQLQLTPV